MRCSYHRATHVRWLTHSPGCSAMSSSAAGSRATPARRTRRGSRRGPPPPTSQACTAASGSRLPLTRRGYSDAPVPPSAPPTDPPPIPGVRRSLHEARGVQFHVTEAGPPDGRPVLALHGWPQHHYCYRDLLGEPPEGIRLIAPDLPGYGWSGPPRHRWAKEDVAYDVLALLGEMALERLLLVGHDWGGWISQLMVLREPDRFSALLTLGIPHVWNSPRTTFPHMWRLGHIPLNAAFGSPLVARTDYIERLIFRPGVGNHAAFTVQDIRWFSERFRDPVCARATTDTYRTFLLRELPAG